MSVGNEGFRIAHGAMRVFVDAFYLPPPGIALPPALRAEKVDSAELILVTHAHADHFSPARTADVAMRTGATVVGPAAVIEALRGKVTDTALVELTPPATPRNAPAACATAKLASATITGFRTHHAHQHVSYLVEAEGLRFFHDGDNEETRCLPVDRLQGLDALMIAPWQGSGWVEFIEAIRPGRWLMMHLNSAELDAHDAGKFLPGLCDHVPPGIVTLRPGESCKLETRD